MWDWVIFVLFFVLVWKFSPVLADMEHDCQLWSKHGHATSKIFFSIFCGSHASLLGPIISLSSWIHVRLNGKKSWARWPLVAKSGCTQRQKMPEQIYKVSEVCSHRRWALKATSRLCTQEKTQRNSSSMLPRALSPYIHVCLQMAKHLICFFDGKIGFAPRQRFPGKFT